MSDDKNQSSKKPDPAPAASSGPEIAVKVMRFVAPTDVPGKDVATSLTAGGPENRARWAIHYLPQLRHFRIVWSAPSRPSLTGFVHETRIGSWERAD